MTWVKDDGSRQHRWIEVSDSRFAYVPPEADADEVDAGGGDYPRNG